MRPEQNDWRFADSILFIEKCCIWIQMSLKFVSGGSTKHQFGINWFMQWLGAMQASNHYHWGRRWVKPSLKIEKVKFGILFTMALPTMDADEIF